MALDWKLFTLLNGLAGRSPALDTLIRLLMNDYFLTTVLVWILFGLWFSGCNAIERAQRQQAVLSAIVTMFLGNLIVKALNLVYYRFRPFAFNEVRLLFYYPSDSSFPSNATCVGFSVATAIWFYNRRVGAVAFVLAILLGLSRIVGGVHYPSDVLGGAAIGSLSAYLVCRRAGWLDRLWMSVIGLLRRYLLA